jgi:hypothetical protein
MAHLGAWLVIAAGLSMTLRHKPVVTVAIALVIWTLIPAVSAYRVVGAVSGPMAAHPATWLVLVQAGVCLLSNPGRLGRAVNRHILLSVMIPVFVVAAVAISVLNGYNGLKLLMDQVVGPAAAFLLLASYGRDYPKTESVFRGTIVTLAAVEALLALIQSTAGNTLLFQPDYETLYWFNPERFNRWMGTTDSPLVLSLLVCVAAPLALGLRYTPLRLGTLLVMVVGVITTQSRTGVATMTCVLVYMLFKGKMGAATRVVSLFLVLLSMRAVLSSTLVSGISSRLSNDTGSSAARGDAFGFFLSQVGQISWVGHGLTSNYQVAADGGLITSLESSFMMFAIDLGLPLAVLYFGSQLGLIMWHAPHNRIQGAFAAAMLGALTQHTFSALGYANMSGFVIWCAIGLVVVGSTRFDEQVAVTQAPARRRVATSAAV